MVSYNTKQIEYFAAESNRQIINRRDKYDYNSIIRSA